MNIVFLAAGAGSRFGSRIKNKSLIKINKNLRIIDVLLNNLVNLKIKKKIIVLGHNAKNLKDKISNKKIIYLYNKYYKKKDMLHSLIMGLKLSNEDTIISYTDIIYSKNILKQIIKMKRNNILLPVKTNWKKIWKIRGKFNNNDAESLKYDKNENLKEIGKRVNKNTKSQFMGLIYIPKTKFQQIFSLYSSLKKKKIQTTNFLNYLIFNKVIIKVLPNNFSWYEFDDDEDLKNFKKCNDKFF